MLSGGAVRQWLELARQVAAPRPGRRGG